MLPRMLIATGLVDVQMNFDVDFPDVKFTTVTTVIEAMTELESNKDTYDYILISATSFVVTDGLSYEETMETLANVLKSCTYIRFALLDVGEALTPFYNKYMMEVPKKGLKNITTPTLRLRNYTTMIKIMLRELNQKPITQEVVEEPVKETPKKAKKDILAFIKPKKELKYKPKAIPEPEQKVIQEPEPETIPEPEQESEPEQIVVNVEEVIKAKEVEPTKEKKRKIDKSGIKDKFLKSSILFTSPCSKVGTTTTAIITARALASCGGTVCYVQITDSMFTCNLYIKSKDILQADVDSPFNLKSVDSVDIGDLVSVYQDVHMITNSLYDRVEDGFSSVTRLVSRINKSFDTVVYDISFNVLKRLPALVAMFKYKNLVLTNSVDCLVELVDEFDELYQSNGDNYLILANELLSNSGIVVSRYEERVDLQGLAITKDNIISCLVDLDERLTELEFASMLGCVVEDSLRYSTPFELSSAQYAFKILENMR